jgi:hypothetical protein
MLKNGWAKCVERKRDPTEEDQKKKDIEADAKNQGKGIWNPHGPQASLRLPREVFCVRDPNIPGHNRQSFDAGGLPGFLGGTQGQAN